MSESKPVSRAVPYVPYQTFSNFLADHKNGLPNRIDAKLLSHISGSLRNQLIAALKFLGLVSTDLVVNDALHRLVGLEGADRQELLAELIRIAYPGLFDGTIDLTKASDTEFRRAFEALGASGETLRKSTSFFLNAARDAQIPISKFIQQPKRGGGGSKTPRQPNSQAAKRSGSVRTPPPAQNPDTGKGAPSSNLHHPTNVQQANLDLLSFFATIAKWPSADRDAVLSNAEVLIRMMRG